MSANNWTQCPRCRKLDEHKQADAREYLKQAYGTIPPGEYLALARRTNDVQEPRETLRENLELGIEEDRFFVDYSASCDVCGYRFHYEHTEVLAL